MKQDRAKSIFLRAVEEVAPCNWSNYLDNACGDDRGLRRHVERLLGAHRGEADLADEAREEYHEVFQAVDHTLSASVGSQIGPYQLREQIGEGGMGVVYVAGQNEPVRRKVALKIIRPGINSRDVVARFELERQALALMDHPNIARIYDGGVTENGQPYIVMELVQGVSITEYCDDRKLTTENRLQLFLSVCRAVYHAHQKGIIHRDLKPSNILIQEIDGDAVPKVIDFGIAKAVDQRLTDQSIYTRCSDLVGTPLYMSPEQAGLGVVDVDTRSDVYSLGVLLYELLTGQTPFDRDTLKKAGADEMRRIIREQEPRRPSAMVNTLQAAKLSTVSQQRRSSPHRLRDLLQGELDWIVLKALEKDRDRRYESTSSLAEDIQRFLSNRPILARPPSVVYRAKKFAQRNRARLAPAMMTAVVLLAGLSVALSAYFRERDQKEALSLARARQVYEAKMKEGVAAWEANDYGALAEIIQETTPTADSPDFRGWEWHFLRNQSRRPFVVLPPGLVEYAAWRPQTEHQMAVCIPKPQRGCVVELWEPEQSVAIRQLLELKGTAASEITEMQWSSDGSRLAIGTASGRAIVHEVATNHTIFDRELYDLSVDSSPMQAMDISSTGELLISANFVGQVRIWDVDQNRLIAEPLDALKLQPPVSQWVSSIAISPDDEQFVVLSARSGSIRLWRRTTNPRGAPLEFKEVTEFSFQNLGRGFNGKLAWHPDGRRIAATDDSIVAIYPSWKQGDGNEVKARSKFSHLRAESVCWIDDVLVTGGADHTIRWWNVDDALEMRSMQVGRGPNEVLGASIDRQYLAVKTDDGFRVLRLSQSIGPHVIRPPIDRKDAGKMFALRWSHGGRYIATGQSDSNQYNDWGMLYIYDSQTGDTVLERPIGVDPRIDWAQDDRWLQVAVAHKWGFLYTVGVTGPRVTRVREAKHPDVGLVTPAVNRKLGLVAFPNQPVSDELRICNLETLDVVDTVEINGTGDVFWSPDGHQLVFVRAWSDSADILLYDAQSHQHRSQSIANVSVRAHPVCVWNPESTVLALGESKGGIHIIDVKSLQVRKQLSGHDAPVNGLAWSPDNSRIASCASDGTLRIWGSESGDELAIFHLPNHDVHDVHAVDWSRDGRRLAVGVRTGEVYVFDAGESMPQAEVPNRSETSNPLDHVTAFARRINTTPEIHIDNFDDRNDIGWTRLDGTEEGFGGPGYHDASTGAYRLTTTEEVPPGLPSASYLMSMWDESTAPEFSNGFVRAKVRVDTPGCLAAIGFRFSEDVSGGHGYLFFGHTGSFTFNRLENSRATSIVSLGLGLKMGLGEEWWIEAGGVGDQLSMKVWQVGTPEPELPQLTIVDSTFTSGRIELETNILWPGHPVAARVDATFDDIYFTPIDDERMTRAHNTNK